ncbi:membrane alanyl aminopeptidase-like [Episyrphus balteatus]|uniref:membrane alanyl aminopeptidase-like n=1 Tax=Episyrphus balteatus TaxID=286459 RepID=UPI002486C1A7|nr:membrane alanyl aminopeptidase-like [Episyrphus balteatus]
MKTQFIAVLALALFATVISVPLTKIEPKPEPELLANEPAVDYRIPDKILPWNYNIVLRPYLQKSDGAKQFTFDGEVYITINTTETNLNTIVMHSKRLTITIRELYETATPATKITISKVEPDDVTDKYTLTLGQALKAKTMYTLHFVYTGLMEDDMHGFYKSSYVDNKNVTRYLGSTQFETNHARRAFPCFDEPKFKATFDVAIIRPRSFKTVSNTRIIESKLVEKAYYKDVFATTPRMSTYILAFLVSDFNERNDADGQFYVVARPEYYSQTEYALDVGGKLLVKFDDYTKLPYYEIGVEKMHLAAIPDFSAGAMENWGLLTYRERSLLYDEGSTTLSAKQSIAGVIAHEQAHMWFGDLVTCQWWSYTWLNEGFARYFQYFMTHEVHPEMEMDKQFVVDQIQVVFTMDATNNTNPMTDPSAASPEDLSRMFNSISYNKGGSVIRMIRHAIGETRFKKSLQDYLNAYKYTNTEPKHIFEHWKANWPEDTKKYADGVLKSFTEQVGYPVINFIVAEDSKSMTIEQKRFLLKPGDGSDSSLLYTVPISYTTNLENSFGVTTPSLYLEATTAKTTVNFNGAIKWVIGNLQETGYYRVNYSEPAWHQLHHALRSKDWDGIHELNRAQYVDDLLALSRSGQLNYELSLVCLNYLDTETHYLPWTAALNGFDFLAIRLGLDKANFAYYITKISKKSYDLLGFEEKKDEKTLDIYTRSKVISWNCKYGHSECIKEALKLFRNMDTKPVPVNIRGAVYCTAMRDGTEADFESLYQKLKSQQVPTEQVLIINNLGCVKEKKLVERYFNIIVSDDIRRQDKSSALSTLYTSNAENVSPVFDLVTGNLEALQKSMGGYSAVASEISSIASRFTTKEQQDKLEAFIAANGSKFGNSLKTLNKAVTTVKENLEWSEKRLPPVVKYLKDFRNSARSIGISSLTVLLMAFVTYMLR